VKPRANGWSEAEFRVYLGEVLSVAKIPADREREREAAAALRDIGCEQTTVPVAVDPRVEELIRGVPGRALRLRRFCVLVARDGRGVKASLVRRAIEIVLKQRGVSIERRECNAPRVWAAEIVDGWDRDRKAREKLYRVLAAVELEPWRKAVGPFERGLCCVDERSAFQEVLETGEVLEPSTCPRCNALQAFALGYLAAQQQASLDRRAHQPGDAQDGTEVVAWLREKYAAARDIRVLRKEAAVSSPWGKLSNFQVVGGKFTCDAAGAHGVRTIGPISWKGAKNRAGRK